MVKIQRDSHAQNYSLYYNFAQIKKVNYKENQTKARDAQKDTEKVRRKRKLIMKAASRKKEKKRE